MSASTPDIVWVAYSTRRLASRSAPSPPHGPNRKIGTHRAAIARPSAVPDPVSCSTRKDATVCIQVPQTQTS